MRLRQPIANLRWSLGNRKLSKHSRWNKYVPIELRKNVDGFNQDEIIERSCVGDNRRHLQTELAVGLAVAFEVFERIFEFDAVVLEEGVDLHAGLEAEELAQQGCGDFAGAVGFDGEGFEGGAGEVLALRGEGCEEFVWKRDGDMLHGFRILEELVKSTVGASKVKTPTLTRARYPAPCSLLFLEIIRCDFLDFVGDNGVYANIEVNHKFSQLAAIY